MLELCHHDALVWVDGCSKQRNKPLDAQRNDIILSCTIVLDA